MTEPDMKSATNSPSNSGGCYAEFGRMAFECLQECISQGYFDCNAETLAEFAVKAGLMTHEPYDPAKHNMEFSDHEYEPGDMIYYWGKPFV